MCFGLSSGFPGLNGFAPQGVEPVTRGPHLHQNTAACARPKTTSSRTVTGNRVRTHTGSRGVSHSGTHTHLGPELSDKPLSPLRVTRHRRGGTRLQNTEDAEDVVNPHPAGRSDDRRAPRKRKTEWAGGGGQEGRFPVQGQDRGT